MTCAGPVCVGGKILNGIKMELWIINQSYEIKISWLCIHIWSLKFRNEQYTEVSSILSSQ